MEIDEIKNTRIFRLKQRVLPWYFKIAHLPGKSNYAADAASRYPSANGGLNLLEAADIQESALMSAIQNEASGELCITWDKLTEVTSQDPEMQTLLQCIHNGFNDAQRIDPVINQYWQYRYQLYELDGVIMYNDRVVVPACLRKQVLRTLHSAHQGVSTMERRSGDIVFWPGFTVDMNNIRAACSECNKNAPSQPHMPPAPPSIPSTPFECIVVVISQR